MNKSDSCLYNPSFSHIYIEKEALAYPVTKQILSHFPGAIPIEINHYKDIFNRGHQNFLLQKKSQKLILAIKKDKFLYEGAPVCQNFGNNHFYYTSMVMNCFYDCEYCYLQGMYPSANMVVFVNTEDFFKETEKLLKKFPVYLCISYDTDLLSLENILGYVGKWQSFSEKHPDLTIELRTKCASLSLLDNLNPENNFILAWTLTPDIIRKQYEHHTPGFAQRLACMKKAINRGFPVRLCFDPILYVRDWKDLYQDMIRTIFRELPAHKIFDVSLGVFRVSADYLKQMRKHRPESAIIQYPYENDHGVCHYGKDLSEDMISFVLQQVKEYIPENKIYIWKETIG